MSLSTDKSLRQLGLTAGACSQSYLLTKSRAVIRWAAPQEMLCAAALKASGSAWAVFETARQRYKQLTRASASRNDKLRHMTADTAAPMAQGAAIAWSIAPKMLAPSLPLTSMRMVSPNFMNSVLGLPSWMVSMQRFSAMQL